MPLCGIIAIKFAHSATVDTSIIAIKFVCFGCQ